MGEVRDQPRGIELSTTPTYRSGQPSGVRLRPVLTLFAYLCAVFVGGALVAPWLYRLVGWGAPGSSLASKPFHRYLDRCLMAVAIAGIWPLLRGLDLRSPWNLLRPAAPGPWRRLARGAVFGFVSLGLMTVIALAAHARQFGLGLHGGQLWEKLAGAMATAIAVGLLEEFLFRGAVYGAIRRAWNWGIALAASSVIYAAVHFIHKSDLAGAVTWHSGLDLLPQMLASLANRQEAIPAFLILTVAGVILALAYQRTGDLYFSMGLHASWVFWIKAYAIITVSNAGNVSPLFGTGVLNAWLAFLILLTMLAALPWLTRQPREESAA